MPSPLTVSRAQLGFLRSGGPGKLGTHVALLRAVNVGGSKRVAMADLRTLFTRLGFEPVQTLLNSGNVVFTSTSRASKKLERLLEAGARDALDLETDFFVRSSKEWDTLVDCNPFAREAQRDPSKLAVVFLKSAPSAGAVRSLQSSIRGPELVRARGKQAYIVYPNGMGRSRLTAAAIEKALGSRGTARNWNTVVKLQSAACRG